MTDHRALGAARENAEWCHTFCESHGVTGAFGARVWSSSRRTPPLYPDAVTLDPGALAEEVLAGIDLSPGVSVKDSFGTLDLTAAGFRRLFDAQWLWRDSGLPVTTPSGPDRPLWRAVTDPAALASWERAWAGGGSTSGFWRPALLDRHDVLLLGAHHEQGVVAGAVLHRSDALAGVSNVFDRAGDLPATWAGCLRAAATFAGGRALVGYESEESLAVATGLGFERCGPLTVWVLDGKVDK